MMLCHDHIDCSMSAVSGGTWHMATNAVGDATHVTKPVQSAHTVQAFTDTHAVVALEDITCAICRKKSSVRFKHVLSEQHTPKIQRHVCTIDIQCSKTN